MNDMDKANLFYNPDDDNNFHFLPNVPFAGSWEQRAVDEEIEVERLKAEEKTRIDAYWQIITERHNELLQEGFSKTDDACPLCGDVIYERHSNLDYDDETDHVFRLCLGCDWSEDYYDG